MKVTSLVVSIFIISMLSSCDNSSSSSTAVSKAEPRVLTAFEEKRRQRKLHRTLIQKEFNSNSKDILNKISVFLKKEDANSALRLSKKYIDAHVQNKELFKLHKKAKEKRLLLDVRKVPATSLERNKNLYARLMELNPQNKHYKAKYNKYKNKIDEAKIKEAKKLAVYGNQPFGGGWNGNIYTEVKLYLEATAHDPDSIDIKGCTKVFDNGKGWLVGCQFRGKNAFGGLVNNAKWFTIRQNQVVNVEGSSAYQWN